MPPPWQATRSLLAAKGPSTHDKAQVDLPWLKALLKELHSCSKNRGVKTWHQHRPATHLPAPNTAARQAAESLRQEHVKHRQWRDEEKDTLRLKLKLTKQQFDELYQAMVRYWEIERTLSDLEKTGSTWTLDTLFKHCSSTTFRLTSIPPTTLDLVHKARLRGAVSDTVRRIAVFATKPDANSTGLKHVTTSSPSEADCRLLIDAVLKSLLAYANLQFRTEVRAESRFLPINRLDYCIYNSYGERVGLLEAKRLDLAQGFVQAACQLLCLQAMDRHGDRPYFGLVSDGYHYLLLIIRGDAIFVDGPGYGLLGCVRTADTWDDLFAIAERLASLMLGNLPLDISSALPRQAASSPSDHTTTDDGDDVSSEASVPLSLVSPPKTPVKTSRLFEQVVSPCRCQGTKRRCSPGKCLSHRKTTSHESPLKTVAVPSSPKMAVRLTLEATTPTKRPETVASSSPLASAKLPARSNATLLGMLTSNSGASPKRTITSTPHSTTPRASLQRSQTTPQPASSQAMPVTKRSKSSSAVYQQTRHSSTMPLQRQWCVVNQPPETLRDLHLHRQPQQLLSTTTSSLSDDDQSTYHTALKIPKFARVQHVLVWPGDKSSNTLYQCLQQKLGQLVPERSSTLCIEPYEAFVSSCHDVEPRVLRFLSRARAKSLQAFGATCAAAGYSDMPEAHVLVVYVDAGGMSCVASALRQLVDQVSSGVLIGAVRGGRLIAST